MSNRPPKPFRIGAVVWALLIGTGIVAFGVSVLLPSTKRARVHFPMPGESQDNAATTLPAASEPTTAP